ncbi:MAG TPA: 3'(2'),5'-bisphosphate nucleotidase CysQ [Rhizomicrobium sp.]|jgi:3'(2'), 5'-bisphosphate nucleotidase|nr:3'(2'),5'-bisphosphate nucleotidase CysQ [Rhizomicrobium sp.]
MTQSPSPSPAAIEFADIAWHAGEIILCHYAAGIEARRKEDQSPVTVADEEAELYILDRLRAKWPDVPVIAEEEAAAGRLSEIGARFFLVDPLDGTKEFISRNGEFTVNIAEIENGSPVRGVVYLPAKDRLFVGEIPGSAFEIATEQGRAPDFSKAKPIGARRAPADGLVAVASRSHRDYKTEEYLQEFPVKDFAAAGSSLKFCLIAAGEADIYPRLGRTMEWDVAAGHAVLAAAGGTVTTIDGRPFTYGKVEEKFANPFFVARGR